MESQCSHVNSLLAPVMLWVVDPVAPVVSDLTFTGVTLKHPKYHKTSVTPLLPLLS